MTSEDTATTPNPLTSIIQEAIRQSPDQAITLAQYMELALYHPQHGYYQQSRPAPGRTGDFLTSPEASPYFGLTVARQLIEIWDRLGQPGAWEIREFGAGTGVLAYDILAGIAHDAPEAIAGLRYRLVESNPFRRKEAMAAMTEAGLADRIVISDSFDPLPAFSGVLLGNEVADAFPAHRLVVRDGALREMYVVAQGNGFGWQEGDRSDATAHLTEVEALARSLPDAALLDVSPAAAIWFEQAAALLEHGLALIIDYGYPTVELYASHRLEGTLRAYRGQQVTDDPFLEPGAYDLTTHVDFTELQQAGMRSGLEPAGFMKQGEFLERLGMGMFLVDLQQEPDMTAEDYLAAKAAIIRLVEPGGLGRFGVLGMTRGIELDPPLTGFRR
ncbi:MAG TPA: SAM-dependent methyltransferase [Thermomicrobiales bacterium]|nr:SAM-dependent methyltransferase [Thermomicrobiales bacterium]